MGISLDQPHNYPYERPSLIPLIMKNKGLPLGPTSSIILDPPSDGNLIPNNILGGDSEDELQPNS